MTSSPTHGQTVLPAKEPYRLCLRSHCGAQSLLEHVGALAEIETAIMAHCLASAPEAPRYAPQAVKAELRKLGWCRRCGFRR
jgi:hypothetical protein